jgi:hypothetical protein
MTEPVPATEICSGTASGLAVAGGAAGADAAGSESPGMHAVRCSAKEENSSAETARPPSSNLVFMSADPPQAACGSSTEGLRRMSAAHSADAG